MRPRPDSTPALELAEAPPQAPPPPASSLSPRPLPCSQLRHGLRARSGPAPGPVPALEPAEAPPSNSLRPRPDSTPALELAEAPAPPPISSPLRPRPRPAPEPAEAPPPAPPRPLGPPLRESHPGSWPGRCALARLSPPPARAAGCVGSPRARQAGAGARPVPRWVKALGELLSAAQLRRLEEHRYTGVGESLFEPPLQLFWTWLLQWIPLWMAPNTIILIGLVINLVSTLVLIFYCPTVTEEILSALSQEEDTVTILTS